MDCPLYVVRVSGASGASVIAAKRHQGAVVYGEVTVAALATDGTEYSNGTWRHQAAYVISPPLRPDPLTPDHLMDLLTRWSSLIRPLNLRLCTTQDSVLFFGFILFWIVLFLLYWFFKFNRLGY